MTHPNRRHALRAGAAVGASVAAKAAADGYSDFMGAAHRSTAPGMYPKLDYDILTDFVPVGLVSHVPQVIVVNPGKGQAAMRQALNSNERKAQWTSLGADTPELWGDDFGRFVGSEVKRWAEVAKTCGAKLD